MESYKTKNHFLYNGFWCFWKISFVFFGDLCSFPAGNAALDFAVLWISLHSPNSKQIAQLFWWNHRTTGGSSKNFQIRFGTTGGIKNGCRTQGKTIFIGRTMCVQGFKHTYFTCRQDSTQEINISEREQLDEYFWSVKKLFVCM